MDVHLPMHASHACMHPMHGCHADLTSSCCLSFVVHTYTLYIYALGVFFLALCPQVCGLQLLETPWRTKCLPILVIAVLCVWVSGSAWWMNGRMNE